MTNISSHIFKIIKYKYKYKYKNKIGIKYKW